MSHAGNSSFSKALKETFTAYTFDLGGIIAGFLVAYQLGVFRISPWAIALYPAVLGAKGIIEGLLSGRLSTALHLGIVNPKFSNNTKSFYSLIKAVIILTLITSVAMSILSSIFGKIFWGITFSDFPAILIVMVATMTMGLILLVITVKVAFFSFKKGYDPDIVVYPVMSTIGSIFITICYIVALNLFFNLGSSGMIILSFLATINLALALYLFTRNYQTSEFIKTIRESLAALIIVAAVVSLTGTLLKGVSRFANSRIEFYTVYPALIGLISDVGSVVGSTATTKLALGMLEPRLSSIGKHIRNIASAWIASLAMFTILALVALLVHGIFSPIVFYNHILVLLVTNIIAVILIVFVSFATAIITFQRGLNPGNFVIPIENAFSASITTLALLISLTLLSLISVI